jgi:5-methylcytosine-specific restriction endonuclease McrA
MPVMRYCAKHGLSPGYCPECTAEKRARLDVHRSAAGQKFRRFILERDSHVCHWCGGPANTLDYVVALAEGGTALDPANAVAACRSCNSRRGAAVANRP